MKNASQMDVLTNETNFVGIISAGLGSKSMDCRYSFARYFTDTTVATEPLPENVSQRENSESVLLSRLLAFLTTILMAV